MIRSGVSTTLPLFSPGEPDVSVDLPADSDSGGRFRRRERFNL